MTDEEKGATAGSKDPVAQVVEEQKKDNIITLTTGIRVKLLPVPASLIDAAGAKIKDPEIPRYKDEGSGREMANPTDPIYLQELEAARRKRNLASLDTLAMFGVELIDGMPPDDEWLPKLEALEELGLIDVLKDYDLENPLIKELVYKKFVGVTTDIVLKVTELSGVSPDDIAAAEESFSSQ
jgi:hypothetical protein